MKKTMTIMLLSSSIAVANAQNKIKNTTVFKTDVDSVSYIIGNMIAGNVSNDLPEANKEMILKGISDKLYGKPVLLSDPSNSVVNRFFKKKQESQHGENKLAGEKFLLQNKIDPSITVTPSGLQYKVITMGTGEKPSSTTRVKVHYHGTTIEGKVFDSSVNRGEPATFGLNQVIPGWTEGLQLMPVGSKFRFYIPQELAYGANTPSQEIKPYSVLIFDVELLSIEQ
ncbi:MAG: FKBP-type peptidyl-prolyl cis-trans isomerase [Crocinitomicaceae bacterium]|jgi:FKBP-type peptidyl-prolyl cis-trans isomerase FklB